MQLRRQAEQSASTITKLESQLRNRTGEATRALKNVQQRDESILRLKNQLDGERDLRLKDKSLNKQAVTRAKDETTTALKKATVAKEEKQDVEQQISQRFHEESHSLPLGVLQAAFGHHKTLPIQPFVVLLVDGDAYSVSSYSLGQEISEIIWRGEHQSLLLILLDMTSSV